MQRRASLSIKPDEYQAFQNFLQQVCGILLGSGKEYLVTSRLSGLLAESGIDGLGGLLEQLKAPGNQGLKVRVIDAMTTNETFWFRDVGHFNLLKDKVLPDLEKKPGGSIRIWSAACSSGQEPYNLSMMVEDYISASRTGYKRPVEILATDISSRMLEQARTGIYCGIATDRGLTPEQSRRFFIPKQDCLEVRPEIRRRVRFRELNLASSYGGLGRFDIIFCRNVLIYFSSDLKRDIVNRMAQALNPGGYLFLGSTESINQLTDRFEMQLGGGICYRLKD
ncbi:MAG: CheR family methyltransferase [Pseudomonadota bacterium]